MTIPNTRSESTEGLLQTVRQRFPGSEKKKVLFTPEMIHVPYEGNLKFMLKVRPSDIKIDFVPPLLWRIGGILLGLVLGSLVLSLIYGQLVFSLGGALWIVLGFFLAKFLYRQLYKERFERFRHEINAVVNHSDSRIFS